MSEMVAAFLDASVRARFDVIIAGGQGDGKTTLLRAMAAAIDPAERIVTIESDFELRLDSLAARHHEVIALEAREANVEGVGRVACSDVVRRAMRMNAKRIIVGEVLGDEELWPECFRHRGVCVAAMCQEKAYPQNRHSRASARTNSAHLGHFFSALSIEGPA